MDTQIAEPDTRAGLAVALGLTAVWLLAAAVQPTATYHLAPIFVAGAAPALARGAGRSLHSVTVAALTGAVIATVAGVLLAALNLLRGPTLLPYGGAFAETITFTLVGATAGLLIGLTSSAD